MVDAPERIWAYSSNVTDWRNAYANELQIRSSTEYVRADIAERENAELRAAIAGKPMDPSVTHGQYVEMAQTLHAACDGGRKRAETAERQLAERDAEMARTFDPDRLASMVANIRQGESDTPRCEPPGEQDVAIARSWTVRVLKAIEQARAALSGSGDGGWRSMESAPKGVDILVTGKLDGEWKSAVYCIRDEFWREDWDEEPTHWTPLPPVPASVAAPVASPLVGENATWTEARELDKREAFTAGWWTNAACDQPADYLTGCEEADWIEYRKANSLDAYVSSIIKAYRESVDEAGFAALPQEPAPEPVAWMFELANYIDADRTYTGWDRKPRLSFDAPCVPEGSIRNLTPLYDAPVASPLVGEDAREALKHIRSSIEAANYAAKNGIPTRDPGAKTIYELTDFALHFVAKAEAAISAASIPTGANWHPLTCKDDRMTCPLPADETVVEVMLNDGTVCQAWYSCNIMEAGDWDFVPVKDDGEPDDDAGSIADKIVAWQSISPSPVGGQTDLPVGGEKDGPVPTHECEFRIGQAVHLASPYPEDDPNTVYYVTGITWEHRFVPHRGWNIAIATAEELSKGHGQTDGFSPSDLRAALSHPAPERAVEALRVEAPSQCKNCGGSSLSWFAHNQNISNGVVQGRLKTNEIACVFVLGCDDCSETLTTIREETIVARLNAALAQSAGGR